MMRVHQTFTFTKLGEEVKQYLFDAGNVKKYGKGEVVFLESEEAHSFYFILQGRIKISRLSNEGKEVLLAFLNSGNFFGEMGVLDGMPRSTDAYADEKSELLVIRDSNLFSMLDKFPSVSIAMLKELTLRIRNTDSQIKGLSIVNAEGKVAASLLRWSNDQGIYEGKEVVIDAVSTQSEMASYVGLSRETYNRSLQSLQADGFIKVGKNNSITVKNFDEFKSIFGPFY